MGIPNRVHPDVGLLTELVYTGRDCRRVAEELASDGRLIRFALVRIERVSDTPFALRRARVVERVLELLHGRDALDREVARHVELMAPLRRDALVIDQTRFDELAGLVAASLAAARPAARTRSSCCRATRAPAASRCWSRRPPPAGCRRCGSAAPRSSRTRRGCGSSARRCCGRRSCGARSMTSTASISSRSTTPPRASTRRCSATSSARWRR